MRIARFSLGDDVSFGVVDGELADPGGMGVTAISGHPFGPFQITGQRHRLDDVRLLSPVIPSKVIGIGRNYAEHAREMGSDVPDVPVTFLKPSTSVVGPIDAIAYPAISQEVHHEAELAVVIGRLCREVPPQRVPEVVLGYTCANDVTARDLQRAEGQWARAKGADTFCPLGPWVDTAIDPSDLEVRCTVNGEVRQLGRTSQMVRDVAALVAHVSAAMTLLPGDVILTGTPAGVGPLQPGDVVSVDVEGIGTLTNRVVARD
ncbi:MAG: fumarylacetoacetate hydrolase family protein [Actinomycetota bacterium]|nr:fumarylacetoacetate hydrolase family protein [Actinomycetota bacterium]